MAAWDQVPLSSPASLFAGQPDYAKSMFDILSAPGQTLRANRESDRDYAAKMQQLADERAYQTGSLDVQKQRLANDVADTGGTYGTQYYDRDQAGNLYPYIISKQGEKKYIGTVPGRTVAVKTVPLDTGTGYTPINPYSPGTTAGPVIPKDVAGAEAQKKIGGSAGEAAVNLPQAELTAQQITDQIDNVINDPELGYVTGWQGYVPDALLTPNQHEIQAKIAQLQGQAFLASYERLKGAGAITEQESAAAGAALTRLKEQRVGDAGYVQALQDFRAAVKDMVDLARRKAAGSNAPAPPDAPPPEPGAPAPPPPPAAPGAGNDPLGIR